MTRRDYLRKAHIQGAEAKTNGYERNSPYTSMAAEHYWYAGYDMIDFDKFEKFVRESKEKQSQLSVFEDRSK